MTRLATMRTASDRPPVDALVIGGMKCGTTALHGYLATHPGVAASDPKECNFFFGDDPGGAGNWWRGTQWYAGRFPPGGGLRIDASPGYTSPGHPGVAERVRRMVPTARLLYLARDPFDRAVSQFRHHRRDGEEPRSMEVALLDPDSQYIARSRHLDRIRPFLERFPDRQVCVVQHRDLLHRRRATLQAIFRWLGLAEDHWDPACDEQRNAAPTEPSSVPPHLREQFMAAVADDARRFRPVAARLAPARRAPLAA